jgi:hypothetical protein
MPQYEVNRGNFREVKQMHRIDAQIKLSEFMGGGDIGDWINKHGADFAQLLDEDPELEERIMSSEPDPVLLTEVKDRLIEMYKIGFEVEDHDDEVGVRAS